MTDENPDATPNLTDSVRLSSTESTDKKFFAARLRQLDDARLNPTPPRYDDVFYEGLARLDEAAK